MGTEADTVLARSIHEAELLLAYAAESGLLKDESIAKPVVEIKRQPQATVTEDLEANFWQSFGTIAALVKPVTVESLRATHGAFDGTTFALLMKKRRGCAAERAVRRYRRWAVGTLCCLVVIQTYYLIGSTIVADITTLPKEADQIHEALLKEERTQVQSGASPVDASGAALAHEDAIGNLEAKEETNELRLETSYAVLSQWNAIWQWVLDPAFSSNSDTVLARHADAGSPNKVEGGADAPTHPPSLNAVVKNRIISETKARFALTSIQTYLLPFLYGFLGTCVYILRNLAAEVKARSFSSEVGYRLRMPLGALAGVAIAWFVTPETTPAMVRSLSPLALAFLAGYSVEVLFTGMDRFIGAFSSGNPSAAGSATT